MELITPSFGLTFWMLIGFGILFFILAKLAWPVIIKMISDREKFIQQQLTQAEQVREDMKNLKSEHQQLLIEAKDERDKILSDARKMAEKIDDDAKLRREKETDAMLAETREAIKNEKLKAITEIKNEIANLSIEVAEKILREEMKDESRQEEIIQKWVEEMTLEK
ncbi:MAG: F0F1 ATP synthase subunit B [Bacteroidetes bacterium]|nr:F0F1 ATP synthase subunit B [Bacteroidota bacterium]MCL2302175.1 F0F1 ATP synthase subunit B [Lentimicrobiaceae bacterium]